MAAVSNDCSNPSTTIRSRVIETRCIHHERFRKSGNSPNSSMSPRQMKIHCQIDGVASGHLEHAMEEMNFSARAHVRIFKVARTLADLAGAVNIRPNDVLEAIQYSSLDRNLFSFEIASSDKLLAKQNN
jgi:magnesium chelatase family protein